MRIYVTSLAVGDLTVRGDEHHYLSHVRRARTGDAIELADGAGKRARGVIAKISDADTIVRVDAVEDIVDAPPRVRVLVPLIKGDRMDTCIEKLVEVGVDEIVVWPAVRAVVKLDGARLVSRVEHYQALAQAAARQSGRASIPSVTSAASLAAALAALPAGVRIVLDPAADRGAWPSSEDLTIISGPEGGFAPEEHDALATASFISLGLGPRVLRAETAPVIAVALVRAATQS
ncbi:MAG TPA: RsmE family RNA methyltransferase [Kofleriaceae bacterium]|nr:RsmE family RNA methyltransferase [Kofleriaceae bacterium]